MGLKMLHYLTALCLILLSACVMNPKLEPREDLQSVFHSHGIEKGTFVLLDVRGNHMIAVHEARAKQRFIPASTFKIANSLIALETGAVESAQEVIPYGGKPQPFRQWEKDMPMTEAIRISNVPVYQEIARRIGMERMRHWVELMHYGNHNIGQEIDQFWLKGPLAISAIEQAQFLARLVQGFLPVSPEHQDTVRSMVKLEDWNGMEIYGKTGWAMDTAPQIGWLVGWVVKDGRPYTYALNIDIRDKRDADKRMPLVKAFLTKLLQ